MSSSKTTKDPSGNIPDQNIHGSAPSGIVDKRGISLRAIIIGILISICHTCWLVYEETTLSHLGQSFSALMLVQSVIGILFIIMIFNSIFKRTAPRLMLSPTEMMVVFSMATISSIIAGFDLLQNLFPVLLWPFFMGAPSQGFSKYFQYIPSYFVPQDKALIKDFFLGTHQFWGFFKPEIIKPWIVPMCFWAGFLLLLSFTMFCLNTILRRQWMDRERLTFPIIELPLMMSKGNTVGSVLKNPLFMTGFLLSAAVLSLNCLSCLNPSIPGIQLNIFNIGRAVFVNPPLSGMNPIWVTWIPYAIGLCYLMPLDVSFSCWFFYVLIRLSMAFATAQGWRDPNAGFSPDQWPFFNSIAQGSWIGMFMIVMWGARKHLSQVFRTAMGKDKIPGDEKEPIPYRAAFFGAVGGFLLLISIAIYSGVTPHIALLFFAIYFLAIIVMTRIYAQIAVPIFELSFFSSNALVVNIVGTKGITGQDSAILTNFHWFDRTFRQHPMGHQLESMTIADKHGQSMRRMSWVILISIIIGIVVCMLTTLQIYYDRGATSALVPGWQVGVGGEAWGRQYTWVSNPKPTQIMTLVKIATSASIVILLAMARNLWFGFPLNPIGYAFASSYAMEYIWNIVFVTWLIKVIVVRYGGLGLYRKSLPFFYGLALGEAVTQLLWGLSMSALGVRGIQPYLQYMW
ncbi:MAG: DUF6785 family protein [Armatimonadota bacterium]